MYIGIDVDLNRLARSIVGDGRSKDVVALIKALDETLAMQDVRIELRDYFIEKAKEKDDDRWYRGS